MFVVAVVIWGSIGIFVRYIPLPSSFIAFARGIIGVAFLLYFAAIRVLPAQTIAVLILGAALVSELPAKS